MTFWAKGLREGEIFTEASSLLVSLTFNELMILYEIRK